MKDSSKYKPYYKEGIYFCRNPDNGLLSWGNTPAAAIIDCKQATMPKKLKSIFSVTEKVKNNQELV